MKTKIQYCCYCHKKREFRDKIEIKTPDSCQCDYVGFNKTDIPNFIGATKYDLTKIPVEIMKADLDLVRCANQRKDKLSPKEAEFFKKKVGYIKSYNYKGQINP